MSYKIAVASTDGIQVDGHFGSVSSYYIYEVNDDESFQYKEERAALPREPEEGTAAEAAGCSGNGCTNASEASGCQTGGCGGHSDANLEIRVDLIKDCRSLLCLKVGAKAERQLERKAITAFQVDFKIEDALQKIIGYYGKIDNHISLRNARKS